MVFVSGISTGKIAEYQEKAVIDTIEGGVMTGDLAAIFEGNAKAVTSRAFLQAVRDRMENG